MLTDVQLKKLQQMEGEETIESAAQAVGLHRTTVERNLLKQHGLVVEAVRTYRLVPLEEIRARQQPKQQP